MLLNHITADTLDLVPLTGLKRCGQTALRTLPLASEDDDGMMPHDRTAGLSVEHRSLGKIRDGLERQRPIAGEPVAVREARR